MSVQLPASNQRTSPLAATAPALQAPTAGSGLLNGLFQSAWHWIARPWRQPPLQGEVWDGRISAREMGLMLFSLAGIGLLLPPVRIAMLGAVAVAAFVVSNRIPSRHQRLLCILPVVLVFAYGLHLYPRTAIHLVPSPRRALEAFFILRILEFAMSTHAADTSLSLAARVQRFVLWIFFFPNLFVGPVYSHREFFSSYKPRARWSFERLAWGAIRIGIGIIKFRFIGPILAHAANQIQTTVTDPSVTAVWETPFGMRMAIVASFVLGLAQFYVVFSGFCDIATALCRWAGFDVYENFENPLLTSDPVSYWKRSNVSTYRWLMHQIFFPFWGHTQLTAKVLTTFAVSGLWHLLWCDGLDISAASQILTAFLIFALVVNFWMRSAPRVGAALRNRMGPSPAVGVSLLVIAVAGNIVFLSMIHKIFWNGLTGQPWENTLNIFATLIWGSAA